MNTPHREPSAWSAPQRFTYDEARARTAIAQRARGRKLILDHIEWDCSLEPLACGALLDFGASDWSVRGEWAGAAFELRLPVTAADQWVRARFPSVEFPALPAPLQFAVFESIARDALAASTAMSRQGLVRIDALNQAPAADGLLPHAFAVRLSTPDSVVFATLSTDTLGLTLLAGMANAWPAAAGPFDADVINLPLRAEIGFATLLERELMGLVPGDAIVLQRSWIDQEGQIRFVHGGWGVRARAEAAHFVVTEPFHRTGNKMDNESEEDVEAIAAHPQTGLEDLPIRLLFDVGQVTMPLRAIRELQVGQVVELDRGLPHAVSIRANGALIGEGSLVEIDGRMAVSIGWLVARKGD